MIPTKPKASAKFPKKLHKYQNLHKKNKKKTKKNQKKSTTPNYSSKQVKRYLVIYSKL